jgi:hypothetical protein
MAKRKPIIANSFPPADMNHGCCVCRKATCLLFKGKRYCPDHHPDPGPYIRVGAKEAA